MLQHVGLLANSMSHEIDGLVQEKLNSIANALKLRLFCTNPSKYATVLLRFVCFDSYQFFMWYIQIDTEMATTNPYGRHTAFPHIWPVFRMAISDSFPKAKTWHRWRQIQIRWWLEPSTRK